MSFIWTLFGSGGFALARLIDPKALLRCTAGRFPDGRILSHDALEGAYLRGAYMSDAEFSDAFPDKPLAYFKRQNRWIRGDWQNARWIFARELSDIDRLPVRFAAPFPRRAADIYRDPLRIFLARAGACPLAAWAALLALLSSLFLSFIDRSLSLARACPPEAAHKAPDRRGRRYRAHLHAPVAAAVRGVGIRRGDTHGALENAHKPPEASPVADLCADPGGEQLGENVRAMWVSVVTGVLLMAFFPGDNRQERGLHVAALPAAAAALALPAYKGAAIAARDRELLRSAMAACWRYLKDFSAAEDNFLPPDNFQEQPPTGAAHRTSPTNIGLALAAAAVSAECGIMDAGWKRRADAAATLEKMPRCMGHYYNWYDTRTLAPLSPPYISTVDSGNMYAGPSHGGKRARHMGRGGAILKAARNHGRDGFLTSL